MPVKMNVSFESHYKGIVRDTIREKLRGLLTSLAACFILLVLAIYLAFGSSNSGDSLWGYLLWFVFLIGIVCSVFSIFFTGKNKGFSGQVMIQIDGAEKTYKIDTFKRGKPFSEKEKLNYLQFRKHTVIFGRDCGHSYRIPKYCLTQENLSFLRDLNQEIIKERTKPKDKKGNGEQK